MIAKVLTKSNREFCSHIFATFNSGWYTKVIVFDEKENKFKLVDMFNKHPLKRKVFIIDTDCSDWIEKDEIKLSTFTKFKCCKGYEWIINNSKLINDIRKNNLIDNEIREKAKELNSSINKDDWHYIKDQKDIENLMTASFGFHDAYISDIKYLKKETYDGQTTVQVLFSNCWESEFLLEFEKDVIIHMVSNDDYDNEIFDSTVFFENGYIYWVDEEIKNASEIQENFTYFKARSLKWKCIINKE